MIWAAVIIASAIILKGTEYFSQMFVILAGGAAGSLIVLGESTTRKETWVSEKSSWTPIVRRVAWSLGPVPCWICMRKPEVLVCNRSVIHDHFKLAPDAVAAVW